jgi:hypothetical protein
MLTFPAILCFTKNSNTQLYIQFKNVNNIVNSPLVNSWSRAASLSVLTWCPLFCRLCTAVSIWTRCACLFRFLDSGLAVGELEEGAARRSVVNVVLAKNLEISYTWTERKNTKMRYIVKILNIAKRYISIILLYQITVCMLAAGQRQNVSNLQCHITHTGISRLVRIEQNIDNMLVHHLRSSYRSTGTNSQYFR